MDDHPPSELASKTILLVNTGGIKKKFILHKIKKLGVNIICLHRERNWATPYVQHWIIADTNDHSASVEAVRTFLDQNPTVKIDGVLTFWDDNIVLTSKLIDTLKLPGVPYSIASKIKNKYTFRQLCKKNGIPAPGFMLIKKESDLHDVKEELKFPVIIKPVYGAASEFVVKVDSEKELLETYKYIQTNAPNYFDAKEWQNFDLVIEEYIDGNEVDIDMIVQHGKIKFFSITDNDQTDEPFFVEVGDSIPSALPEKDQQALVNMAEEALEKLGVQNSICHFEAKSTSHGPVPIELNLRMGGDYIYDFVKGAWGVDLIEYSLKIAMNVFIPKITKPEVPLKYMAGKYFLSEYSGVLVKVSIDESIKKDRRIEEFHFMKEVGDPILMPPEGFDPIGWFTVSGPNRIEAEDALDEVFEKVKFEITRFHSDSSLGKTERKRAMSYASLNKDLLIRKSKIEKIRKLSIQNQRNLKIGVAANLYNDGEGNEVELDISNVPKEIYNVLAERGYQVALIDFNNWSKAINDLQKGDIDLVFNVSERINNSSLLEPHVASILDVLQIPYTGSNPFTLALCIDKIRVKKLLTYHNIPTPKWDYVFSMDDDIREDLTYPLIVKPANTDNSIGITNDSVVTSKERLLAQVDYVLNELKSPALIEEYIDSDEYDVSIIGSEEDDLRVLPLSRSVFKDMPEGYWNIYPFEAKFTNDEIYKNHIEVQKPPKNIPKKLEALISEISLDTYNILDCHDYGRVEVKCDRNNNPYVLELNPNPSIGTDACVPAVAKLTGMDYGDFIEEIIRLCIKRYKDRPPYFHLQTGMF